MSPVALFNILSLSFAVTLAAAQSQTQSQFPATPLAEKHFAYPTGIPDHADTDPTLLRGPQHGFNICNSTTENQQSLCQTSIFNGLEDFCLWAPPKPNSTVADTEGEMVAWCTKPGHGTRLIPDGAITGVQYLKTPDYIQVAGFIKQELINMAADDYGGEMDPHGADLRGNPIGGLMYSTNFTGSYVQVIEWTNFMGGKAFCLKACNPAGAHAADYCQHVYDRIGCAYNAPNAAKDKVFESCDADNADFPGVYTSGGATHTYTQPAESLGAITTIPFTPRVPSSSNCKTFSSAALYTGLPTATVSTTPSKSGASSTSKPTAKSGTSSGGAQPSATSNASALVVSSFSAIFGVVFAALFLS